MSDFKIVKLLDPISLTLTGPNFQGVYSSGTTYQAGMSVSYNGSSYVALQATTGNVPTNTTYWQLLAAKGDAGAGSVAFTCRNSTGTPIQAFRVVYISGSTGNEPNITLALGNNDPNSSKTFGVTPLVINNNTNGTVVHNGEIDNLNTSAFTAGDLLWLSPTTPGLATTTRPPAPDHAVFIGYVVRSHPTQGKIIVTIQNGFELNELHNVLINGISNGQVIQYESATSLWKNHTLTKSDVGLGNVPNVDATNPSNIIQDANHRFVTDTEKTTWNGKQDALGFTPENVSNKDTSTSLGTSDTLYPTQKAVKTYVDTSISGAATPDATTIIKGKVKLAGDLGGTAELPTVPGLASKVSFIDMQKTQLAYVSPSGSNTTGDGSFARPYLTIAHTIANTLDGATIFLLPGLYTEATIVIPANTGSRAFRGFSANATELQNGITHTASAVNAGFSFDSININSATLNEAAAINGFIYFTKCWFNLTRTDNNSSVAFTSTESNISSASLSGAINIFNEALVIGAITCSGGFNIFENCKFVTTLQAQGATIVRMLDCELFGATVFVNGTIVSTNTPSWEVDLSTEYLGTYTGSVNKTVLANISTALGFTPEDVANKSTTTTLGTSDTLYPSQNAVKVYIDNGISNHEAATDPHPQYTTDIEVIVKAIIFG